MSNSGTIESYIKELNSLADKMKDDNLSLDESFKTYKKGLEIIDKAEKLLETYRGELEILQKDK